jgi:hypothetical protein
MHVTFLYFAGSRHRELGWERIRRAVELVGEDTDLVSTVERECQLAG